MRMARASGWETAGEALEEISRLAQFAVEVVERDGRFTGLSPEAARGVARRFASVAIRLNGMAKGAEPSRVSPPA